MERGRPRRAPAASHPPLPNAVNRTQRPIEKEGAEPSGAASEEEVTSRQYPQGTLLTVVLVRPLTSRDMEEQEWSDASGRPGRRRGRKEGSEEGGSNRQSRVSLSLPPFLCVVFFFFKCASEKSSRGSVPSSPFLRTLDQHQKGQLFISLTKNIKTDLYIYTALYTLFYHVNHKSIEK